MSDVTVNEREEPAGVAVVDASATDAGVTVADSPTQGTLPRSQVHVGEPEGDPLMDAQDLIAGYLPGVNILNGASLTLHDGEIVGIVTDWCTSGPANCCCAVRTSRICAPTSWFRAAWASCRRRRTCSRR